MQILSKPAKIVSLLVLLSSFAALAQNPGRPSDAQLLAEAERAFARTALEKSIREAFLTWLADDAIIFRPGPINGKESWRDRPNPKATLIWEPILAATARGGDLGYTTGPAKFESADKDEPIYHGQFVSVWKKQTDGTWKVRLDLGIQNPAPSGAPERLQVRPGDSNEPESSSAEDAIDGLFEAERTFIEQAKNDLGAAFDARAAADVRVFRDGSFPAVGKDAARALFLKQPGASHASEQRGEVSRAGDLGFTFGESAGGADHLNYLRIWRKERTWHLVLDLSKPFPQPNE